MSVAILGGIDRLKPFYERKGKDLGFDVRVFSRRVPNLTQRLQGLKGIVIFTGTIAHPMVEEAKRVASRLAIPIKLSHSSSVSGLKRALSEF